MAYAFLFSWGAQAYVPISSDIVYFTSIFLSYSFAPLIGWLADVRFGRYEVIKFGSIASFLASILYYIAMLTGGGDSILSIVLLSVATVVVSFGLTRTACVSSGWTRLIRSLTPSSSSCRYSTTLGSTDAPRDAVPSPISMRNSPHEWTMARTNLEAPSLKRK